MCHAAVAKIDDVDEKHGKNFRKWWATASVEETETECRYIGVDDAARSSRVCRPWSAATATRSILSTPSSAVGACESKTEWAVRCTGIFRIGRHTKSLKACPSCGGEVDAQRNGSTENATPRTPTKFALFVKENYQKHRTKGCTHAQVMKVLSAEYKATVRKYL